MSRPKIRGGKYVRRNRIRRGRIFNINSLISRYGGLKRKGGAPPMPNTWKLDCGDAGIVDGIADEAAPDRWTDGGTQSYGNIDCTTSHY